MPIDEVVVVVVAMVAVVGRGLRWLRVLARREGGAARVAVRLVCGMAPLAFRHVGDVAQRCSLA